jgi:hypothetical protein
MRAEIIAHALAGHRCGAGWIACCPAHDDHPSLSLRDSRNGKLLAHFHTGCSQATLLSALRAMGLWHSFNSDAVTAEPTLASNQIRNDATATDRAWRLWLASEPAKDTRVGVYLKSRGLTGPFH